MPNIEVCYIFSFFMHNVLLVISGNSRHKICYQMMIFCIFVASLRKPVTN